MPDDGKELQPTLTVVFAGAGSVVFTLNMSNVLPAQMLAVRDWLTVVGEELLRQHMKQQQQQRPPHIVLPPVGRMTQPGSGFRGPP